MPEVLDPVAPPVAQSAVAPLAPPTVVEPTAAPVAQVVVQPSPTQREDDALANRDVKQLTNIAKDNIGTPAGEVALGAARGIQDRAAKFGELVNPIDKAGGATTPEGRVEIAKQFQTVADRPQWGTALLSYVMGDKKAALLQVTGGNIKTSINYDNAGNQIEEKHNELGEAVSYFDRKEKRFLTKEEYAKRVGGISAWENTLKGKLTQETQKLNNESFQKDEEAANTWHQIFQGQKQFHTENLDFLTKVKTDIPAPLYNKIVGSVSQSLGQANASSNGKSVFNQIQDSISNGKSVTVTEKMAGTMGVPKNTVLNLSANGEYLESTDKKHSVNINKLKAQTDTENVNQEATKNASQTMSSIAEAERLGQLTPVQAQKLRRVIENSQTMGREIAVATEKYGRPAFVSLPTSASFVDKQAQVMAQSLQALQNADQMDSYINYRKDAKKGYEETNTVPAPGEIGNNYLKQKTPQQIRDHYSNLINGVMDAEYVAKNARPAAAPAQTTRASGPAAPPATPARPSLADLKKKFGG
jgi:hypothetical protein